MLTGYLKQMSELGFFRKRRRRERSGPSADDTSTDGGAGAMPQQPLRVLVVGAPRRSGDRGGAEAPRLDGYEEYVDAAGRGVLALDISKLDANAYRYVRGIVTRLLHQQAMAFLHTKERAWWEKSDVERTRIIKEARERLQYMIKVRRKRLLQLRKLGYRTTPEEDLQESLLTIVVIPSDERDECELFLKEFSGKFLDEWVEAYREWWPENNGKGQPPREVGFFVKKWWIFMGKRWLGEPPEEVVSPKRIDALVKMKKRCEQRLGRRVDWNEGRTKYLTGTAGAGGIHLGGSGGADGGDDDSDDGDSGEDGDGGEGGSAAARQRARGLRGRAIGRVVGGSLADDDEDDGDSEEPGFVFADERGNEGMEPDEGDAPAPAEAPTKGKRKAPEPSSRRSTTLTWITRTARVTELLRASGRRFLRLVRAGHTEWCARQARGERRVRPVDAVPPAAVPSRPADTSLLEHPRPGRSRAAVQPVVCAAVGSEHGPDLWHQGDHGGHVGAALAAAACEPSLKAAQTLEQWEREFKARVTAKDARVAERKRAQAAKKASTRCSRRSCRPTRRRRR